MGRLWSKACATAGSRLGRAMDGRLQHHYKTWQWLNPRMIIAGCGCSPDQGAGGCCGRTDGRPRHCGRRLRLFGGAFRVSNSSRDDLTPSSFLPSSNITPHVQVRRIFLQAIQTYGWVDVLVNNAGDAGPALTSILDTVCWEWGEFASAEDPESLTHMLYIAVDVLAGRQAVGGDDRQQPELDVLLQPRGHALHAAERAWRRHCQHWLQLGERRPRRPERLLVLQGWHPQPD